MARSVERNDSHIAGFLVKIALYVFVTICVNTGVYIIAKSKKHCNVLPFIGAAAGVMVGTITTAVLSHNLCLRVLMALASIAIWFILLIKISFQVNDAKKQDKKKTAKPSDNNLARNSKSWLCESLWLNVACAPIIFLVNRKNVCLYNYGFPSKILGGIIVSSLALWIFIYDHKHHDSPKKTQKSPPAAGHCPNTPAISYCPGINSTFIASIISILITYPNRSPGKYSALLSLIKIAFYILFTIALSLVPHLFSILNCHNFALPSHPPHPSPPVQKKTASAKKPSKPSSGRPKKLHNFTTPTASTEQLSNSKSKLSSSKPKLSNSKQSLSTPIEKKGRSTATAARATRPTKVHATRSNSGPSESVKSAPRKRTSPKS